MPQEQFEILIVLIAKAESGEDWAKIARLEAEMSGGPFFCPTCGVELSKYDTLPCRLDYGLKCGVV